MQNERACVEHALPYPRTVPWRHISVRLDATLLGTPGAFAAAIRALDLEHVARVRRRLDAARGLFVYDWTGTTFDAFSALMVEVCGVLGDVSKS